MQKKTFLLITGVFTVFIYASTAHASTTFFVDSSYHWQGKTSVEASLHITGENATYYIEDEYWNSLSSTQKNSIATSLNILASEFDSVIYPKLRDLFGSEAKPGIDNDPKIVVLFIRMNESAGGYFNTADGEPRTGFPQSNEKEILYLNSAQATSSKIKAFLAHEFQHLITYYQKDKLKGVAEEVWLNEARSEYAPTYLGYDDLYPGSNLEGRVAMFLTEPSDSLVEWQNQLKDYAQVNLFFQYLIGKYGGSSFIRAMMNSSSSGIASINEALSSLGYKEQFADIYTDWTITNMINNCGVLPAFRYCYDSPNLSYSNLHITFQFAAAGGNTVTEEESVKDWEAIWNEYTPGQGIMQNVLEIDFSTSLVGTKFVVPYIITKTTGEKIIDAIDLISSPYQRGTVYISNFGVDVSSVVIIPSSQQKMSGFGSSEFSYPYTIRASLLNSLPIIIPSYPDGSLVRATGDTKVYVIHGGYKRWIRSPTVFSLYGHLRWEDIIDVSTEELNYYEESTLMRAAGDENVYHLDFGNIKYWLNMSAEDFSASGRKWESIFIINERERDFYFTGDNIIT